MSKPPTQNCTQPTPTTTRSDPPRKLLFASAHSIVDFSNGAAVATLDVLRGLAMGGFACQAFCTSRLDFHQEVCLETILAEAGEPHQVRASRCG